jgi:Fur family ferric uptake transcriptional regulator
MRERAPGAAIAHEIEVERAIRASGRRLTTQRSKILCALRASGGHATAEQIYARVSAADPHAGISLSTVYRTLEQFAEARLVARLDGGSGSASYEWRDPESPHQHLLCGECGAVAEVELPELVELGERIRERTGFEPDIHHLGIGGLCTRCAPRRRQAARSG